MSSGLTLNVFTPLPPQETDIARFSVSMLRELSLLANVRVWTSQNSWDDSLGDTAIRRFSTTTDWSDLNTADANFYNIGNNAQFHRDIMDVARVAPGIVILHDTHLHHFFASYSETPGRGRDLYLDSVRLFHGDRALEEAKEFLSGRRSLDYLVETYPMTCAALEGALAAVLHNKNELQRLSKNTSTPLYYQPLSFASRSSASDHHASFAAKTKKQIIIFGYLGRNRRLPEILTALASMPDRDAFRLDIYGSVIMQEDINDMITRLGLDEIVRNHGYVDEEVLHNAIGKADLAINLRSPTMGEASGSQLRIWSSAVPSLVTRTGWYGTLPDDAVFFVDTDREVETIQLHLRELLNNPMRFKAAGLRGRFYFERDHHPSQYARSLIKVVQDIAVQHARLGAHTMGQRSAHIMRSLFGAQGGAGSMLPVAQSIYDITAPLTKNVGGDQ